MRPSVSVIVPVRNARSFLETAVASIRAQGLKDVEVIVVDDGSTDGSDALAAGLAPRVRLIRQAPSGPAVARNTALAAVEGELVAFLDADDLWPRGRLLRQRQALSGHPELDGILGLTQLFAQDEEQAPDAPHFLSILGAGLFRRRLFERVGGFDPGLRIGEDLDWFLRAREAGGRLAREDEVALQCRKHASNLTRGLAFSELGVLGCLRRSLVRRRQRGDGPLVDVSRLARP